MGDHFRSDAGEGCVEGGKRRLGIDKKGIFLGNGTGFDDGNADGADPVIGVIGCFYCRRRCTSGSSICGLLKDFAAGYRSHSQQGNDVNDRFLIGMYPPDGA